VLQTVPASANVGGVVTIPVPGGLPAGSYDIVAAAINAGFDSPAPPVALTVVPAPLAAPRPQGAPAITRGTVAPVTGWVEVGGGTQRVTSASQANTDSATLAYPSPVRLGSELKAAGAVWGASPSTGVTVTGTGAGCAGLPFSVSFNTTAPPNVTWRTFIATSVRTTSAGPCTLTVNPSGSVSDFSWSQDEFSGPTSTEIGATPCIGTNGAPSCPITAGANALIVAVTSNEGSSLSLTEGAGWQLIGEKESNAGTQTHSAMFRIVPAAQISTASWAMGGASPWAVQVRAWVP
jgi:hypothetical protein